MRKTVQINSVYLPLYDLRCRYMINYGGRRSAKSVSVSQLLARRALENPARRILCMRKYATTLRLSCWERIQVAIDEAIGLRTCEVQKVDREIHLPNGSVFLFLGADDPQKLKSLEGITDIWLEEANEFTEEDFNTLDAGLSAIVDPPPQVWFTFNPIPHVPRFRHWIQERFLQVPHELGKIALHGDAAVLRTYYRHNAFCPAATVRVLEGYRLTNPSLYRMWGLGEFTTLEGVILTDWDVVEAVPEGIPLLGYGLDFGFADDPAALVTVWAHNDDLWVRELVYASGLTNPQLSTVMQEAGLKQHSDHIIADSAEPKSIQELRNMGWIVTASEKGPDYKHAAARYLQAKHIHLLGGSTNLNKEIATWSWKRDKQGHALPIPEDGNDHAMDALIYRTYRRERIARGAFELLKERSA